MSADSAALRAGTLRLTVAALGVVLGLSGAAVLPLLLPWAGALLLALFAMALALLPFVGVGLVRRLRRVEGLPLRSLFSVALGIALVSGLAVVPLFSLYHGQVRVLNLGEQPFDLFIDERRVAHVEPSSGESALAGVELTVPAGERELRVVGADDRRELFRARELVEGGSPHLFVPLRTGYCFSIERRSYGDAEAEARPTDSEPLEGDNPFWRLPEGISWFAPNPEPGPLVTSGGTLSSLRQKRCAN